jgi:methionyl-tRNA formyltransferase
MRVLFWGTPEFAAPALRALAGEGFDVAGVITQPDKPQGRSRSALVPSPVKTVALEEEIAVLQPDRPRGEEFLASIRALNADISVVVAYGHILPANVIVVPRLGTLNIHASLLPALRGAAPIQAAIRDGFTETGVTIMRMVEALDAGPILLQETVPILADETYGELQLRLAELGAQALIESLALIEAGASQEREQDAARATYAPKVTRDMARIVWTRSAVEVARMIRAYDPKPGAWTVLRNAETRVAGARVVAAGSGTPGTVVAADKTGVTVNAGAEAVAISFAQPAGKKRLSAQELVAGRYVAVGDILQ